MRTLAIKLDPDATDGAVTDVALCITLADGRELSAPIEWFPAPRDATDSQRRYAANIAWHRAMRAARIAAPAGVAAPRRARA